MKISHRTLHSVCLSVFFTVAAGAAAAAPNYRAENLPAYTPSDVVTAIGPSGVAVGSGTFSDYPDTTVIWDQAGNVTGITNFLPAIDINASGQILVTGSIVSSDRTFTSVNVPFNSWELTALNDSTQVAGYAWRGYVGGVHTYGAFVWQNGVTTDLPALPNGGSTYSTRINNHGVVVGRAINSSGETRAVMWKDGVIVDLGTLPGDTYSAATGVNDLGQIVGVSTASGKPSRGYIWNNGVMSELTGFAADLNVNPAAINNAGLVTGIARQASGRNIAFAWSNGAMRDLTPVMGDVGYGCYAFDLNDAGQIVGLCGYRNIRITPTAPATDVGAEVIATKSSATQGSPYSYTIKISNVGALPASGVTLTDTVSAGATLVSAAPSQGSCSASLPLVCTLGDLASDAVATVQLTVIPTAAGLMTNSASIATNEVDTNALNNTATHGVSVKALVIPADLGVTVTGPTTAKLFSRFTYTMTVTNSGPADAKTVTLSSDLASSLSFVSASTTHGTCFGASCSLGTLASGATATVNVTVRSLRRGTYISTPRVTFSGTDSNTANNTATITTVVK